MVLDANEQLGNDDLEPLISGLEGVHGAVGVLHQEIYKIKHGLKQLRIIDDQMPINQHTQEPMTEAERKKIFKILEKKARKYTENYNTIRGGD